MTDHRHVFPSPDELRPVQHSPRVLELVAAQIAGPRVLHMGCGEGSATRLLAGADVDIVGIDPDASAIKAAREALADDAQALRSRLRFDSADPSRVDFDDASFETVLLDGTLGRSLHPERILAEAARLLVPEGRVVVAEPVGRSDDGRRVRTFTPSSLVPLIDTTFALSTGELIDGWLIITSSSAGAGQEPDRVQAELASALEQTLLDAQADAASTKAALARTSASLKELQDGAFAAIEAVRSAAQEDIEAVRSAAQEDIEAVRSAAQEDVEVAGRERKAALAELERQRTEAKAIASQLADAKRQHLQARRDADAKRRRITKLESDRASLRNDLATARWRLASMRARKWWRLGGLLGQARRNPGRILLLPFDVVSLLGRPSQLPARPQPQLPAPPSTPTDSRANAPTAARSGRPPVVQRQSPIPRRHLPVAVALPPMLSEALSHEWQQFDMTGDTWLSILEHQRPSLVVIAPEAVGPPTVDNPTPSTLDADDLLERCRRTGTPVVAVIGLSGDLDDRHLDLASRADAVVSFDNAIGERLRGQGLSVVDLSAGVQPRLHNPIRDRGHDGDIVTFSDLGRIGAGLRESASKIGLTSFPSSGRDGPVPSPALPDARPDDLEWLPKRYKVAISPAGGQPWIDLAVAATGTPIVSLADGESVVDPEIVTAVPGADDARSMLRLLVSSRDERTRRGHRAMRAAIRHHHIGRVADRVLELAGAAVDPPSLPHVTITAPTNRPDHLETILENVGRQTYPQLDLLLVAHGFSPDESKLRDLAVARGIPEVDVIRVPEDVVAGEVFNRGFREARGALIAKMDDDDWYGPDYLWDQVDAVGFSGAHVVGKWAHYAYIESLDSTVLRFAKHEHEYRDVLAISTLLMRREVFETAEFPPMPYGAGSVFLRELMALGCRLYSADRFNYLYHRYSRAAHHTFPTSDLHLAANARTIGHGYTTAVAEV